LRMGLSMKVCGRMGFLMDKASFNGQLGRPIKAQYKMECSKGKVSRSLWMAKFMKEILKKT
jgi:hypothetical protein